MDKAGPMNRPRFMLLFFTVLSFMASCQETPRPRPNAFTRRGASDAQVAENSRFEKFIKQADQLQTEEDKEKFAALLGQFQLDGQNKGETAPNLSGRCVLFMTGETALASADLLSDKIALSPDKRLAYSTDTQMTSDGCQSFFMEGVADRYSSDFFKIHVALFAY